MLASLFLRIAPPALILFSAEEDLRLAEQALLQIKTDEGPTTMSATIDTTPTIPSLSDKIISLPKKVFTAPRLLRALSGITTGITAASLARITATDDPLILGATFLGGASLGYASTALAILLTTRQLRFQGLMTHLQSNDPTKQTAASIALRKLHENKQLSASQIAQAQLAIESLMIQRQPEQSRHIHRETFLQFLDNTPYNLDALFDRHPAQLVFDFLYFLMKRKDSELCFANYSREQIYDIYIAVFVALPNDALNNRYMISKLQDVIALDSEKALQTLQQITNSKNPRDDTVRDEAGKAYARLFLENNTNPYRFTELAANADPATQMGLLFFLRDFSTQDTAVARDAMLSLRHLAEDKAITTRVKRFAKLILSNRTRTV